MADIRMHSARAAVGCARALVWFGAAALVLSELAGCTPGETKRERAESASVSAVTPLPADVVVYGKRPATFRGGLPFVANGGIFEHRQQDDDPLTRIKFVQVDGLENHLGVFPDRIGSFGKYVFTGNSQTTSIGGDPKDSAIGVFDSETKRFCSLLVSSQFPSSINNLATANPKARKSRIILAPGAKNGKAGEPALAYARGDLDSTDPCAWPVTIATPVQLNAGFSADRQICPNNFCVFDSMALVAHEDVAGDPFGRDYVALGEYFHNHLAVVRIDANGISTVATYTIPLFTVANSRGACYSSGAARRPAADFRLPDSRPANDWRILFSYDSFQVEIYSSPPPAHCVAPQPFCPLDAASGGLQGTACPSTGSCAQGYCAGWNGVACSSDDQCRLFGQDFGPCTRSCLLKAPLTTCRTATDGGSRKQCLSNAPNQCPTGETCSSEVKPPIVGPAQEYRFDRTTSAFTPTSPMFFGSNNAGVTPTSTTYDSERSLWVQADPSTNPGLYRVKTSDPNDTCTIDGVSGVQGTAGEHCYYNLTNPPTAVTVLPDQVIPIERTPEIPYLATTAEVDTRMYIADTGSLQYAQKYAGAWFPVAATDYKSDFGFASGHTPLDSGIAASALPAELKRCDINFLACNTDADCAADAGVCLPPRRCSATSSRRACRTDADCPPDEGTCISGRSEDGVRLFSGFKFVEAGGSPLSLWVTSGYGQGVPVAQSDMFLVRVPAAVSLTDNLSAVRPATAWSGDRLWLVAEHGGQLQYRIRDDGQWSGWSSLGTNNVTTAGGPAVVADASSARIYARDATGTVYEKRLTSAINCAAGSCAWTSWAALPASLSTDDVAATNAGTQRLVALHASDDRVYANFGSSSFGAWFVVGTLSTNAAPAVTYHAPDGHVWIAARQRDTGAIYYSRIDPSSHAVDPWTAVPTTGAPSSWGTGPALVSDGQAVRLYAVDSAFPQWAYQAMNDGSGWSAWRKPIGGSWATRQPAATAINGEVNLLTYWYTGGMQEALLP